jgi:hypothetical protein
MADADARAEKVRREGARVDWKRANSDRVKERAARMGRSRFVRKAKTLAAPVAAGAGIAGAVMLAKHLKDRKAEQPAKTKKAAAPKFDPAKARKMVESVANFRSRILDTPKRGALTGGVVGGLFSGAGAVGKEHDERAKDIQAKLSPQEAKKAKRLRLVGHAMNMATGVGTGSLVGAGLGYAHRGVNKWGAKTLEQGTSERAAAVRRGLFRGIFGRMHPANWKKKG